MTLDKFVEILHKQVDQFKADWMKGMKKNPKNWPSELDPNDIDNGWATQFVTHLYNVDLSDE